MDRSEDHLFTEDDIKIFEDGLLEGDITSLPYKKLIGYIWADGHVEMADAGGYRIPENPPYTSADGGSEPFEGDNPCLWMEDADVTIQWG